LVGLYDAQGRHRASDRLEQGGIARTATGHGEHRPGRAARRLARQRVRDAAAAQGERGRERVVERSTVGADALLDPRRERLAEFLAAGALGCAAGEVRMAQGLLERALVHPTSPRTPSVAIEGLARWRDDRVAGHVR